MPQLRKIHSRTASNTGGGSNGTTTTSSSNSNSSGSHAHHYHLPPLLSLQQQLLPILQQLPPKIRKYLICIIQTTKQIFLSLLTMDTLMGILIGLFLFTLLQRSVVRTPQNINSNRAVSASSSSLSFTTTTADTNKNGSTIITIGFAVSITGCGPDPITEGAAILQHSIHRSSIRGASSSKTKTMNGVEDGSSSSGGGRYDYQMYAIYHPSAKACAMPLHDLGYTLLERETPIEVSEIRGEYLRNNIGSNGCCGEKELIKLHAYTLIQHPLVVHLDLDTLLIQPLDPLFDFLLLPSSSSSSTTTTTTTSEQQQQHAQTIQQRMKEMVMWPDQFPDGTTNDVVGSKTTTIINAMYTYDYNMVNPKTRYKPVQGGFLLLRPSLNVYREFQDILRDGDFRSGSGWGGLVGPFYGSMTFQGIIPYYYNVAHPNTGLELHRCYINSMADNPRTGKTINNVVQGDCRTGQTVEQCLDCRTVPLEQIYTVHFTICQKPWSCLSHDEDILQHRLCRNITHEWYKIRNEYQHYQQGDGTHDKNQFYGYCQHSGSKGYLPIPHEYYRGAVTNEA